MGSSAGRRTKSSAGRRKADYVRTRTAYQQGATCWMCGTYGRMTVDHVPPLSTAPNPETWDAWRAAGRAHYEPACQPCQSRQGAAITNRRSTWTF